MAVQLLTSGHIRKGFDWSTHGRAYVITLDAVTHMLDSKHTQAGDYDQKDFNKNNKKVCLGEIHKSPLFDCYTFMFQIVDMIRLSDGKGSESRCGKSRSLNEK